MSTLFLKWGAELHDDLIQRLSVLRLHLDKLERSYTNPKETQATIQEMQHDFQGITDAVRRISRRLHHARMDDDSLEKSLELLCQNMDTLDSFRFTKLTGYPSNCPIRAF